VHVTLLGQPSPNQRDTPPAVGQLPGSEVLYDSPGVFMTRRDAYAIGAPPTLMLWQQLQLRGSPLERLGGAMRLGQLWVAQRELWWSGHPTAVWQRQDHTTVLGPAPLRGGDTLTTSDSVICVEH
jgi:hypothetical protein